MEIHNVFVVGAGVMGSGITQVIAQSGFNVKLMDVSDDYTRAAMDNINNNLGKLIKKALFKKVTKGI